MKKRIISLVVIGLAMLASTVLFAQEWSTDQKEVWKNVETYWDLGAKGDVEGFLGYFHSDFSGWINTAHLPHDRATRVKFIKFSLPKTKTLLYNIQPVAIKIHGNVAIVHYSYTEVSKYGEEKEKSEQGRWTDILIKQGDKWIMIGDHGGATSEDQ
ncbi:MAG: nuclear transport factor 2 family protein [bacterium]